MLENYTLRSQANFGRSHFGIDAQRKITAQVWNSCLCEIKRSYTKAFSLEKKKKKKRKKKNKNKTHEQTEHHCRLCKICTFHIGMLISL